jgi:hypothetical protein
MSHPGSHLVIPGSGRRFPFNSWCISLALQAGGMCYARFQGLMAFPDIR